MKLHRFCLGFASGAPSLGVQLCPLQWLRLDFPDEPQLLTPAKAHIFLERPDPFDPETGH
jgi:hypothetical protein